MLCLSFRKFATGALLAVAVTSATVGAIDDPNLKNRYFALTSLGFTWAQTLRVSFIGIPGPVLNRKIVATGPCTFTLSFKDQNGGLLGPTETHTLKPGAAVSVDLPGNTVLPAGNSNLRQQVFPSVKLYANPAGVAACAGIKPTQEIYTTKTGKTVLVVPGDILKIDDPTYFKP